MPKVSVVIPSYNRANMVGAAIQSVLEQTYTDLEVIVVDDGSSDNTREVVKAFTDSRIRYIYQENKKLPGARNTGIEVSQGNYVAFLDSDDFFLPEKLARQIAAIECDPKIGLIASGWQEVDEQRTPLRTLRPWLFSPELTLNNWLYSCPFTPSAVLARRDWLTKVGMFDPEQYFVEDWDLWLRLVYAGCRMAWEPAVVSLRTIHGGNMVHNAERMNAGLLRVFDKFFDQPDLSEHLRQQKDDAYAHAHIFGAVRSFGAGAQADGQKHLAEAIRLNPHLLEGTPPQALRSLASAALSHQVHDIRQYVADVAHSSGKISPQIACSPRKLWGMIRATAAFEDFAYGRRSQARLKAARALFTDPAWIRNRGLLSILLKP